MLHIRTPAQGHATVASAAPVLRLQSHLHCAAPPRFDSSLHMRGALLGCQSIHRRSSELARPPRSDLIYTTRITFHSGMTAPPSTPRRRPTLPLSLLPTLLLLVLLFHAMPSAAAAAAAVTTTRLAAALTSRGGSSRARAAFILGSNLFCAPRTIVPGRRPRARAVTTTTTMNAAGGEQQAEEGIGEAPSYAAAPQPSSSSIGGGGGFEGGTMDFFRYVGCVWFLYVCVYAPKDGWLNPLFVSNTQSIQDRPPAHPLPQGTADHPVALLLLLLFLFERQLQQHEQR